VASSFSHFHLPKAHSQRNSTLQKTKQISCISIETVHFDIAESSFSHLATLSSLQSHINTKEKKKKRKKKKREKKKEKLIVVVLVTHNKVIQVLDVPLEEILKIIGRNMLSQKIAHHRHHLHEKPIAASPQGSFCVVGSVLTLWTATIDASFFGIQDLSVFKLWGLLSLLPQAARA
jgi:hypothetical protein